MLIYARNRCEGQVGEGGKGAGGSKRKLGILAFFKRSAEIIQRRYPVIIKATISLLLRRNIAFIFLYKV